MLSFCVVVIAKIPKVLIVSTERTNAVYANATLVGPVRSFDFPFAMELFNIDKTRR